MSSAKGGSSDDVRPLSPHLQVYSMRINMLMSIVHRITGAGLYFGMALFVWWLFAAGHSAGYFDFVQGFIGSWFGRLVLLGFTWALVHHALGQQAEFEARVEELATRWGGQWPSEVAHVHAWTGDVDEAFDAVP